jgi:hypothetical protein
VAYQNLFNGVTVKMVKKIYFVVNSEDKSLLREQVEIDVNKLDKDSKIKIKNKDLILNVRNLRAKTEEGKIVILREV